jgi:hypothetical protein
MSEYKQQRAKTNRTEPFQFGSVRVDPNRTRTNFLKMKSNRTELEPAFRKKDEPNRTRTRKSQFDSLSDLLSIQSPKEIRSTVVKHESISTI